MYNFCSGTWHTTGITEFWPLPLEQQLELVLKSKLRLFLSNLTYFVYLSRFKVEQGLCKVVYFFGTPSRAAVGSVKSDNHRDVIFLFKM